MKKCIYIGHATVSKKRKTVVNIATSQQAHRTCLFPRRTIQNKTDNPLTYRVKEDVEKLSPDATVAKKQLILVEELHKQTEKIDRRRKRSTKKHESKSVGRSGSGTRKNPANTERIDTPVLARNCCTFQFWCCMHMTHTPLQWDYGSLSCDARPPLLVSFGTNANRCPTPRAR